MRQPTCNSTVHLVEFPAKYLTDVCAVVSVTPAWLAFSVASVSVTIYSNLLVNDNNFTGYCQAIF